MSFIGRICIHFMIHLPQIKKEGMPLEVMNSKMRFLDAVLKCLIQVKDNTFLCYFIIFKYRFSQDCYNENYFLDTQSKKQKSFCFNVAHWIELLYWILFLGDREHQLKGSFSRKPATTTRQSKFNPKKFSSFFF